MPSLLATGYAVRHITSDSLARRVPFYDQYPTISVSSTLRTNPYLLDHHPQVFLIPSARTP